jgi:hypothetical protein
MIAEGDLEIQVASAFDRVLGAFDGCSRLVRDACGSCKSDLTVLSEFVVQASTRCGGHCITNADSSAKYIWKLDPPVVQGKPTSQRRAALPHLSSLHTIAADLRAGEVCAVPPVYVPSRCAGPRPPGTRSRRMPRAATCSSTAAQGTRWQLDWFPIREHKRLRWVRMIGGPATHKREFDDGFSSRTGPETRRKTPGSNKCGTLCRRLDGI